jgi:hypothetical protein
MPRLELKIRRGKGGISSPTSSGGHVVYLVVTCAFAAFLWPAWPGRITAGWLFGGTVVALFGGIALRDAIAWFVATSDQRATFRAEVARLREDRRLRTRSTAKEPWQALAAATLIFAPLAWIFFANRLMPLIVIPLAGWLYVVIRLALAARRSHGRARR